MIRYVLQFCLCPPDNLSPDETEKWDKEWSAALKPLTLRMTALGAWQVDLTAHGREFLEFLLKVLKQGGKLNSVRVVEQLIDDDKTPVEWFVVHGRSLDHFEYHQDHEVRVKADRMKPEVHLAGWLEIFVSERFRAIVERHRLTGIEFIWCPDIGKYQAAQWYLTICKKGLGRGLDHPWIDTTKLNHMGSQVEDPSGRHGQKGAFAKNLKPNAWSRDPLLAELLPLVRSMELLKRSTDFGSFHRYLRNYLPDTDFAYTIQDVGNGPGRVFRHRGLAMNRKATDLLRANGVVTDEQCEPVLILDQPPERVENLDEKYGPAEPAFSPKQMARLRELEAKAWAEHISHPKPPRAPDLKRSLSLLRSRKRQEPKEFAKPASAKAIEEWSKVQGREMPAAWQQVLRISNGGRIDKSPLASGHACIIMPLKDLAEWQRSESKYYRGGGAELPDSMLFIIHTELGDSIWLDTAQPKPGGDCRVVLMSHETWAEERDWPTVAEFLEELLTETQEEET